MTTSVSQTDNALHSLWLVLELICKYSKKIQGHAKAWIERASQGHVGMSDALLGI